MNKPSQAEYELGYTPDHEDYPFTLCVSCDHFDYDMASCEKYPTMPLALFRRREQCKYFQPIYEGDVE